MAPIRIFIVDDHDVVRQGLRSLVADEPDLELAGDAGTAAEALARIPAAGADVTLLDLNLPDGSGIDVCRRIRSADPDARFLVLTSSADDEALLAAILAGADGYVLKHVRSGELVEAIRQVALGRSILDQRTRDQVLQRVRRSTAHGAGLVEGLSPQEDRVLTLLAGGLTNRAIADELGLAEKTVKNYVSNVLGKLGMTRRTEAAVFAAGVVERGKGRPRAPSGGAIRY